MSDETKTCAKYATMRSPSCRCRQQVVHLGPSHLRCKGHRRGAIPMWPLHAMQMVCAAGLRLPRLQICHHRRHSYLQGLWALNNAFAKCCRFHLLSCRHEASSSRSGIAVKPGPVNDHSVPLAPARQKAPTLHQVSAFAPRCNMVCTYLPRASPVQAKVGIAHIKAPCVKTACSILEGRSNACLSFR